MQKTILLLLIFSIGFSSQNLEAILEQEKQHFNIKTLNKNFLNTTKKITYYYQDQQVGYLYYERLPLSLFIVHTFFIRQENRNQGHGTALLQFACNKLKYVGARKIIIQPGPFEREGNKFIDVPTNERTQRLDQLARLYKSVGFSPAPRIVRCLAKYLYKIINIDEDAHYLVIL